ncbi:MAG TPA: hypothetical protein VKE74_30140 [Gemmataceae bacterium]|nr:hypothetical protein [Gemmataceae bacterium]
MFRTFAYPTAGAVLLLVVVMTAPSSAREITPTVPERPSKSRPGVGIGRIEVLVVCIDRRADKRRSDWSPAVIELIEIGEPAIPAVLGLMTTEDELTRRRAEQVLRSVTMRMYGFIPGQGWAKPADQWEWRKFWYELGNLDATAPLEKREASVELWRKWLAGRAKPEGR